MSVYKIRAHHGMCLSFFQGKGYSGDFVENMVRMKAILAENPEIILMDGPVLYDLLPSRFCRKE